jgi:hypothetical protein
MGLQRVAGRGSDSLPRRNHCKNAFFFVLEGDTFHMLFSPVAPGDACPRWSSDFPLPFARRSSPIVAKKAEMHQRISGGR